MRFHIQGPLTNICPLVTAVLYRVESRRWGTWSLNPGAHAELCSPFTFFITANFLLDTCKAQELLNAALSLQNWRGAPQNFRYKISNIYMFVISLCVFFTGVSFWKELCFYLFSQQQSCTILPEEDLHCLFSYRKKGWSGFTMTGTSLMSKRRFNL